MTIRYYATFDIKPLNVAKPVGICFKPRNYPRNYDLRNRFGLSPEDGRLTDIYLLYDEAFFSFNVPNDTDFELALSTCYNCPLRQNLHCIGPHEGHPDKKCPAGHTIKLKETTIKAKFPAFAASIGPNYDPSLYSIDPTLDNNIAIFRPLITPFTNSGGIVMWSSFITPHISTNMRDLYVQNTAQRHYGGNAFVEAILSKPHRGLEVESRFGSHKTKLQQIYTQAVENYGSQDFHPRTRSIVLDNNYSLLFDPADTWVKAYITTTNAIIDPKQPDVGKQQTLILEDIRGQCFSLLLGEYIEKSQLRRASS